VRAAADMNMPETPLNLLAPGNLVGADLDAWMDTGGGEALDSALQMRDELIALVEKSGLRGMGGAGFPVYRKWSAVAAHTATRDKHLICNGNEDEPGTFKDRLLLERAPHQVIEGMLIAGLAVGASRLVLYVNPGMHEALATVKRAVAQWCTHPLFARLQEVLSSTVSVEVFESSGLYIAGEETAAVAAVEGAFPFPRAKPPFPADVGVEGRPTLVNNVETLANVPNIVRHGAHWFRALGIGNAVGTKIYSLSGDVLTPGVHELPMGTRLGDLVFKHGGGMLQGKELKAVFTGGPSNTILTRQDLDVALDFDSLRARRSSLGTGAMIVVSEGTGIVKRVTDYVDFFAGASCGQCPSCKIGTHQISGLLQRIDTGAGRRADLEALVNLCRILPGSGRCGLIDGAVTVLDSSLVKYRDEYRAHLTDA
jgi:NADH-quinone oxidoreductase subunit F